MAVATAHNQVTLWNWRDKRVTALVDCEVHCILYPYIAIGNSECSSGKTTGSVPEHVLVIHSGSMDVSHKLSGQHQEQSSMIFCYGLL